MKAIEKLKELGPCHEATKWINGKDPAEAWKTCQRGDWMLWLCGKLSGPSDSDSRHKLVLCACQCARQSLQYVETSEDRPLKTIETAEKWANGDTLITLADVRRAAAYTADAAAAYAAYAADAYTADAYAAAAAAYAAYAAAAYAAYAANAAANAAAAARIKSLSDSADIVRRFYPTCPLLDD